ncbi:MAG: UDP-N-acetylmuramoyl-tripeptide--D-alanyl-D-alanine ligase [Candidatus Taylorbacteria bacterium]|nr:UDP-N-acetylmuramoyl-tripeptide--D-alanyl-D-alanine ligase [Candidatus Taylorbacteria bacterium]
MKSLLKKIIVAVLTWEAKAALRRHDPGIIAITGNVGKTSTKDAVYAVVSASFKARKSQKSMNSEIGLPLAILGLENGWSSASLWAANIVKGFKAAFLSKSFPELLVLEVGADRPGDIESVSKWLRPDIVVLTRMSLVPVHVENFPDSKAVLREKMFLAHALRPEGTLVVNADDLLFEQAVKDISATKVFYGSSKGAMPRIVESSIAYDKGVRGLPVGQRAVIDLGGREAQIELRGVLGDHLVYPLAAACAVARVLHIEGVVPSAFDGFESPKGRMRMLDGTSGSIVLDDTYNSSPLACAEAIKALSSLSIRGRKIAALGDMKELGENAESAHREIGRLVGESLHMLFAVGEMSRYIAAGASEAGMPKDMIRLFDSSEEAAKTVADLARAGDAILVKGSQSMRMEKVSKALLADPSKASELLVRQEDEWAKR